MTESPGASNTDPRLGDPLSEVTRKERLYLLAASTVGITIISTGLVPTEIRTLGITFAQADQDSLLFMLALVVAYFLVAFIIYAASDFLAWRRRLRAATLEDVVQQEIQQAMGGVWDEEAPFDQRERQIRFEVQRRVENRFRERALLYHFTGFVSLLRGLFEFGLPVIYGIMAVWIILFVEPPPTA